MSFKGSKLLPYRQIFIFDGKGRLSVKRVKMSTAENAVKKGRARWVGPDAIQHCDIFGDEEVTFDFKKFFPCDDIVIYGLDALSGEDAPLTTLLLDDYNGKRKQTIPERERGKVSNFAIYVANALLAANLMTINCFDRAIIGILYVLSGHPLLSANEMSIIRICRVLEYPLLLSDIVLPEGKINPGLVRALRKKIEAGYKYRPLRVGYSNGKFDLLKEREMFLALREAGFEKIRCRIVKGWDRLVVDRREALWESGIIKKEFGETVLTERVHKYVRYLVGKAIYRRIKKKNTRAKAQA